MLLEHHLNEAGHHVRITEDGRKAIDAIAAERPDLVVSDVRMPVMDGFEMCLEIKSDPALRAIPVLLLTSENTADDVILALNAMADGYVTKPYNEVLLLEKVASLLAAGADDPQRFEPEEALEVSVGGTTHTVTAGRRQIFSLFISAYENSVIQNDALIKSEQNLRDINQRLSETLEHLSASEERFRSLVHTIPDIVYKIDEEGCFTFLNGAIQRLGYQPGELIGRHFSEILFLEDVDKVSSDKVLPRVAGSPASEQPKLFDEKRTGERMTVGLEVRLKTKTGEAAEHAEVQALGSQILHVEINSSGVYGEISDPGEDAPSRRFIGTVGVVRDIRARREIEENLRIAKDAADVANQAKSEFLSSMSHELRTPMNAILGFSQMLGLNPNEPLSDSQKTCVDRIIRGGNHLTELINGVLDLAKIEAGKIDFTLKEVCVADVLRECLTMMEPAAASRDVDLRRLGSTLSDAHILADATRLQQIFLNLLSNAIKYNQQDGSVTCTLREVDGNSLRISVTDDGKGIPDAKRDQLFLPFSRLGAETSGIEGTGVGLSVTKQLVELMKGAIDFKNQDDGGCTFWVEFPIVEAPVVETGGSPVVAAANQLAHAGGRMLYVEDTPDNMELMKLIVSRIDGLELLTATDAEAGLALARKHKLDLIILDINLPGMSGYEALAELQQTDETSEIPVIALSAAATQSDIDKGLAAGFRHYLTKPMMVENLIEVIGSVLSKR